MSKRKAAKNRKNRNGDRPKDDSIELSPKYGVNPALEMCFWCGESKGVALLGRLRKDGNDDAEAPKKVILGLDPCEKCKKKFAMGVHIIEVSPDGSHLGNNENLAFRPNGSAQPMWPTGRWAVMNPEAMKNGAKAGSKMLCDKAVLDRILSTGADTGKEQKGVRDAEKA